MSPSVPHPRRLLSWAVLAGAVCWLGLGSGTAAADPLIVVDGETLDIQAERLDVDIEKGTALLQGKVRATLGDLEVHSPKVEVAYDEAPRVRWAKGTGGVRAKLRGIDATASSVELDVAKRRVTLLGSVKVSRGKGWVEAAKAEIDLGTRKVTLHDVKGSIPVEPPKR